MKLFENEYVILSIDEQVPCLEWIGKKGFLPSDKFRKSEEKSLQLYREYHGTYPGMQWLADTRKVGAVSPEDMQWVTDEILPQFVAMGLTKEAFITPAKEFGKMTVSYYKSTVGQPPAIRMFKSVEAAKKWLGQ